MRVSQAGKKWNMIQGRWYLDQSHEQRVETGGAEKGCFLIEEEGTVRVREAWKKKITVII